MFGTEKQGRRRAGVIGGVIAAVLVMSGCGAGNVPEGEMLYEQANAVNGTFRDAVADVQRQLFEGEWEVLEYGDAPSRCDSGYEFYLTRQTPRGFSVNGQGREVMQALHGWLSENGWNVEPIPTFGEGIDVIMVIASKPDENVARLDVDLRSGPAEDSFAIRATSTCQPGEPNELMTLLFPGFPGTPVDRSQIPRLESPGAPRTFGLTADGLPRTP